MRTLYTDMARWIMKALWGSFGHSILAPFVIGLLIFIALVSCQSAHATTLYIVPDNGTDIAGPAGTTNLNSGNTGRLTAANAHYRTLFSTVAPTANNTRMREAYSTSGTWYSLGKVYFDPELTSNATISAGATGKFYLVSETAADDFRFQLRDYDPSGGDADGVLISESAEYTNASQATSTPKAFNVTFGNAQYTLNQGHYLMVEIWFKPSGNNRDGYVYCNGNNTANDSTPPQSRIDIGLKVNITSSAGANGSISGPVTTPGTALVDWNSSPTYTITANPGYTIQSLLVDGVSVPGAVGQTFYSYPFSSVKGNHTIDALFNVSMSTFNISPGNGGCISLGAPYVLDPCFWSGGSTYSYTAVSGTYPFEVTPNSGYGIEWVRLDGADQGVPLGQTTPFGLNVDIGAHNTLSASFLPYYVVTASAGTGGSISPAGTTAVLKGQALTLDITPDNGYRLLSITDNGVNVGNTSPYTITNISQDHTVVATFQRTYTINASAGPNGIISPIGEVIVDSGGSRNFSLTGDLGFRVSDVLVDGVSVGAVTSYIFSNISADHTISVTFETAPLPSTYCAIPPFITTPAPPNVMLMLSVESPMEGAANPTVTCTGKPSATNYACSSSGLGAYDNSREYYGYFESGKCYTYSGSGATGLFTPSGAATNHQCPAGTAWSGNMLNWSTMLAVDAFRKAFTGGNRIVDDASSTILLGAVNDGSWFPVNPTISNAELYMPVSGTNKTRTIVRQGAGIGFGVCNEGQTSCSVGRTGSGQAQWPTAGTNTAAVYSLRIKACDSTGGVESRCNSTTNKPEGTIQKYMDKMRFALMSYAADNDQSRDGGVLRSVMKWVGPTIAEGMLYHDASGNVVTCNTAGGCVNPEREVETTGILRNNPAGATSANSGIINYINKFAYTSGYKAHDPMGEMFYEVVRYFKNLTPSVNKYCSGLTSFTAGYADGFAFHCNSTKTNTWGWRDPALYSCSQNFVVAVNDANPWLDKRVPGSAFKGNYGGSAGGGNDWCGSSQGACDSDFLDGATQVDVEGWTNKVGDIEGLTGQTLRVACEVDATGACIGGFNGGGKNVVISKLGRIIGTPPGPGKENSYNVAGLAYYAHMTDLRSDLAGTNNLTTYMIDTQEPNGTMLVGPFNMLYLAAKYGGFNDKDDDQSMTLGGKTYNAPYRNVSSCGGVTSTPNTLCSEWDADNDGNPDNYFFASDSGRVENALNSAFSNILTSASSGTAAAVANNKSGERGANIIQALFYPQWPNDKNIKWLGEVQALWYYLDPVINFSTVREDTDGDFELDLTKDFVPSSDPFVTRALWKAGVALHLRAASDRQIYTLLDSTKADLTDSANAFTTAKRTTLKPLMDIASLTDTEADSLINYLRGVDGGVFRSRTVTSGGTTACWKLGDVINSTPQVQSSVPTNAFQQIYADSSYSTFILSDQYKGNDIVYSGANDGMMHAFKLGDVKKINDSTKPFRIAGIVDSTDLGKEEWAFIPRNALPYLKNQADQNYCHQYLVDGAPVLFDASIAMPDGCTATNYWDCEKKTTLKGGSGADKNQYLPNETSWKSILIGSMGLGGASRNGSCNETLNHDSDLTNNIDCVKTPVADSGFSSYFALDVTAPLTPKLMWEISDANLPTADRGIGLTTPGVAIVRINAQSGTPAKPDRTKNGRWFAVFASGPTGTIDTATRQFLGRSDQNLKIYVVDIGSLTPSTSLAKNTNYWVFDTGVKYAFANSMSGAAVDLDRSSSALEGNYSDDVIYVTYTRASLGADNFPVSWNKGGVMRLVTNNSPDPANWFMSSLIDGIGPITTSIGKLQDRNNKKLWVYFGEGRYFYKGDELNDSRRIFGIADPCYSFDISHINTLSTTAANCPAISVDGSGVPVTLKDQTNTPNDLLTTENGWYITLDGASGTAGAERVVSDVTASLNGIVFYTTYVPDSNICTNGGITSLWAVKYNSGGTPPIGGLKGKAPLQTSSGGIAMIDLASSFTNKGGRKLSSGLSPSGMAPKGRFPPLLQPKAVKKVLNLQER